MQFWELSKSLVPINHELYSRSCDFLYKYPAARRIFNSFLGVWISRWYTVSRVWYITWKNIREDCIWHCINCMYRRKTKKTRTMMTTTSTPKKTKMIKMKRRTKEKTKEARMKRMTKIKQTKRTRRTIKPANPRQGKTKKKSLAFVSFCRWNRLF